jgi:hypothetical protein
MPKSFKLVGICYTVQVLGFVTNEQCFNILAFMKNKVHNWLNTHLDSCVKMFGQTFFTLENFHMIVITTWKKMKAHRAI